MADYIIKKVSTMEEIHGIVEIQRQAWKMPDLEIVPTFEMKAVASFGTVLVAINENQAPIGFIYAFPKFPNIHYSHMMATLPEWQGKGVGYELKKFHRNLALNSEIKIESIIWTVDPLLSNNAYLNFAKLGGECNTYYSNYYGDPEVIGIYKGLPTDRFLLEWKIHSPKVARRMENYKTDRISFSKLLDQNELLNEIDHEGKFSPISKEAYVNDTFIVEIPDDFQKLKSENLETALDWRIKFREICLYYFEKGYCVIDFHSFDTPEKRRNFYQFAK